MTQDASERSLSARRTGPALFDDLEDEGETGSVSSKPEPTKQKPPAPVKQSSRSEQKKVRIVDLHAVLVSVINNKISPGGLRVRLQMMILVVHVLYLHTNHCFVEYHAEKQSLSNSIK